jgi:adenylate cyclase
MTAVTETGRYPTAPDAAAEAALPQPPLARRREVLVDDVTDWVMNSALTGCTLEDLLVGSFDRLLAAGLPVTRANVGLTTLHPLFESITYVWTPDGGLKEERFAHGSGTTNEDWKASPLYWLVSRRIGLMRRRLQGPEAMIDFPLLRDLAGRGYTDYVAWMAGFAGDKEDGAVGSFATDRPGGFTEGEVAALKRVQQRLAVALKVVMREQLAANVLSAYLGEAAADRVLNGQIRRGDGQRIQAAIWYSDLRGSTELAERVAPETYLETLDAYFEATAGAVMAEGGQVLLLIGDAVLAIFPVEAEGPAGACRKALCAATRALDDMAVLNLRRDTVHAPTLRFGLGLHVGELLFGNIGTRDRLEFTAVGPAVNVAARLEELSKELDSPVIASRAFALNAPDGGWRPLGARALRGIAEPVDIVCLPPEPAYAE